ncbi:MAG: preprotein translocase subunit SecE [Elusimicrobia bacterium CG08_land_8_20_14_0_20_51_18]|nr:MAG: preprotein translocase subunit SecE [Elusimicrobia bacterium CG08_land_8_20_14_0_20_51_18]
MNKILAFPKDSINFTKEAYSELQKVNWLARKDVVKATIGVAFVIMIVAIYISLVDLALSKIVKALIGGR